MTPEEFSIKQLRLMIIENIATLAAIVVIVWVLGWPHGMWGFVLLLNLSYVKKRKEKS
jgi:hypothetical protein